MENFVIANPTSVFNLFGWGFLLGSMFSFIVMLAFDWLSDSRHAKQKP